MLRGQVVRLAWTNYLASLHQHRGWLPLKKTLLNLNIGGAEVIAAFRLCHNLDGAAKLFRLNRIASHPASDKEVSSIFTLG